MVTLQGLSLRLRDLVYSFGMGKGFGVLDFGFTALA